MFSLARTSIPRLLAPGSRGLVYTSYKVFEDPVRTVGPWPRTQEERERAAKKYNLIPEDYEPHDYDDAFGDYPKLKPIGDFNRDPYDDFDDPDSFRFHGEVFHKDYDRYLWERVDPLAHEKQDLPLWVKFVTFIFVGTFVPITYWFMTTFKININHNFKQRGPYPDRILYEFPSIDSGLKH